MLSTEQRLVILELSEKGQSTRRMAHVLGVSRWAVREVIHSQSSERRQMPRPQKTEPYVSPTHSG